MGEVVLQLHLLCTERGERQRAREGGREIKESRKRCAKKMKEGVAGVEKESGRSVRQIMKKGYLVAK